MGNEGTDNGTTISVSLLWTGKFAEAEHFYAWEGYDFAVLNELDDEDLIRQGNHRSKSVYLYLTETGKEYAQSLLKKYGIDDWKGTTA